MQLDTDSNNFQLLERLIVVLYDKSSPLTSVNEIDRIYYVRDLFQWIVYRLLRMRCFNIFDEGYTRQESGQPAQKLNKWFLPPNILAWLRSLEHGCLFG